MRRFKPKLAVDFPTDTSRTSSIWQLSMRNAKECVWQDRCGRSCRKSGIVPSDQRRHDPYPLFHGTQTYTAAAVAAPLKQYDSLARRMSYTREWTDEWMKVTSRKNGKLRRCRRRGRAAEQSNWMNPIRIEQASRRVASSYARM